MHDIFISYSTKDQLQADTLRDILEKNRILCWMAPRDIPGGSNYTKEIPTAIRGCQIFVLVLSQNSQNSPWVLKELDAAVNCGKVILPFMLEDFQLRDEFNFLLTGAQRYAAYQKKADALEALIGRIHAILQGAQTEPAAPAPTPASAPVKPADPTYFGIAQCPACGGNELTELKKVGKITAKEKASILLIPVCGIIVAILALLIVTTFTSFGAMSAKAYLTHTYIWSLVGFAGGCWLGNLFIGKRIRRKRIRDHIHPHPMRCAACDKVFLIDEV